MTRVRRAPLLAAVLACGLVAAPAASAAKRVTFDVPAAPVLSKSLKVTIKAPRLPFGTIYRVAIERPVENRNLCVNDRTPAEMRELPGGRFTATLRPKPDNRLYAPRQPTTWCPGPVKLLVERYGPGTRQTPLAKRAIRFTRGPGEVDPPPIPVREVAVTLLPGSTLTAWAPGRPDRSTPVTGTLVGRPGGITSPKFLGETGFTGTLALPSLATDPLCPGSTPPTSVEVDGSSVILFDSATAVTLSLVLRGQADQLFGCGAPGGLTGTTTLTSVSSAVGLTNRMPMIGVVGDIALPGGSQGGITTNLLVNWGTTDRWLP